MPLSRRLTALAAMGVIALVAAGCAGSPNARDAKVTDTTSGSSAASTVADSTTSADAGTTAAAADGTTVTVALAKSGPFAIEPSVASVAAGKTTFDVTNDGTMVHELVVLQTDKSIKELTKADGSADEATNIGETGDVEAGASKSFTVDLKPGHYWLICNIPGHFAGGMYTEFTVTA